MRLLSAVIAAAAVSAAFLFSYDLMSTYATSEADLAAIEELHRRDMAAAKAYDVETLVSLWTQDIVALPPGGPPAIGREKNRAGLENSREASAAMEIVEYVLDFQEVQLAGDYAFEWGFLRGAARPKSGGETIRYSGKLMRVLRRQPDGAWKVARTIWNLDSQPGSQK